jgi:hypothetical protein
VRVVGYWTAKILRTAPTIVALPFYSSYLRYFSELLEKHRFLASTVVPGAAVNVEFFDRVMKRSSTSATMPDGIEPHGANMMTAAVKARDYSQKTKL